MTRATLSRVIMSIACRTLRCSVAWTIFIVIEAQHQIDVVLVGAGLARDEGRIAVERDAGERDRGLVLRGRNNGVDLACERGFDRCAGKGERGAPARRAGNAEVEGGRVRLRAGEHIEALVLTSRHRQTAR